MKTTLHELLALYRRTAVSEREKGTYFERLVKTYLTNESPVFPGRFNPGLVATSNAG